MALPRPPENGEKLRQLYVAHAEAVKMATWLLRTGGKPLEGEALKRAVDADAEVAAIARQIKELIG